MPGGDERYGVAEGCAVMESSGALFLVLYPFKIGTPGCSPTLPFRPSFDRIGCPVEISRVVNVPLDKMTVTFRIQFRPDWFRTVVMADVAELSSTGTPGKGAVTQFRMYQLGDFHERAPLVERFLNVCYLGMDCP